MVTEGVVSMCPPLLVLGGAPCWGDVGSPGLPGVLGLRAVSASSIDYTTGNTGMTSNYIQDKILGIMENESKLY